jgi:uncharacterized protein YebE (UPF0316 family)
LNSRISENKAYIRERSTSSQERVQQDLFMVSAEVILPLTILVARIVETTLETIRMIYITRGHMYLASGIGVIKVAIWLLSTGLVLTNLQNIAGIVAYIAGYGIGTIIGMELENRISIGSVVVRVISTGDPTPFMQKAAGMGYGITRLEGSGYYDSTVTVLLMVVPRKELSSLLAMIHADFPDLLFTVEDVRKASESGRIYYGKKSGWISRFFGW